MYLYLLKLINLLLLISLLSSCNINNNDEDLNDNLINKVNAISNSWINYEGEIERKNSMLQSQFIPYDFRKTYHINHDAYLSYYNGEEFIKTELYEDTPREISTVQEADGVILSFNKENKSGMQLVEVE